LFCYVPKQTKEKELLVVTFNLVTSTEYLNILRNNAIKKYIKRTSNLKMQQILGNATNQATQKTIQKHVKHNLLECGLQ